MNFKERLAATQAKMDDLKVKMDSAAQSAKAAYRMKKDEIRSEMEELEAAVDELDAELEEFEAEAGKKVDDKAGAVKGNAQAAKENARLIKERTESKLNAARLKLQMSINAAKARIADKKEAYDKSKQEARITALLDYADRCEELAAASYLEAQLTLLEAAAEILDYAEKFEK